MFSSNSMVNNGIRGICRPSYNDRIVGQCCLLVCHKCKKEYVPDESEIWTKNPNVYCKNCKTCRDKMRIYHSNYEKNKKNNTI